MLFLCIACSTQRKIEVIRRGEVTPYLSQSDEVLSPMEANYSPAPQRDTLKVTDDEGKEMLIMKAVRDEDGEMVATDVLDAAVVSAKFRNVAERMGKVDLTFRVTVPASMQDSRWQLRFRPFLHIMEDTVALEPILITGSAYRNQQLRGYQQYEKFLNSIINDTTLFINMAQLEVFIERNIPEVYALKRDSSFVSDEVFESLYGVTEKEAIEHYSNRFARTMNDRRRARSGRMYSRYVKVPIISEGLRLDTVIRSGDGDFIYDYVQTVNTRPKLRKVDAVLTGEIFEQDIRLYTIPQSEPLTFYISSLSSLADNNERYLTKVIERSVEANTACYIDFEKGQSRILPGMGNNGEEIARIKANLRDLITNDSFILDSILVTASSSPEGGWQFNASLAQKRSEAVSAYFSRFMSELRDSIDSERGLSFNIDDSYETKDEKDRNIVFTSRSNPENWSMLDALVREDTSLTVEDKTSYSSLASISNLDSREHALQSKTYYRYLREKLYPRLRTVRFDFYLHRKGMVKDTVHTTVLDSVYMRGLQAISDRDYPSAVTLLRPYEDINTAIAYCAMDYNESAFELLSRLERTAAVNYMLAIVYSRRGDDRSAVECYLRSCAQNPSYVYRGGLDPEISALIRKYNIHKEDDEIIPTDY